jgi:hypothetical protein
MRFGTQSPLDGHAFTTRRLDAEARHLTASPVVPRRGSRWIACSRYFESLKFRAHRKPNHGDSVWVQEDNRGRKVSDSG